MSARKPARFAAVMALMALAAAVGGVLGIQTESRSSDFEWSAPASTTSVLHP